MYLPNITKPVTKEVFVDLKAVFKDKCIFLINNEIKISFDVLKAYKSKNKNLLVIINRLITDNEYSVVEAITFVVQR